MVSASFLAGVTTRDTHITARRHCTHRLYLGESDGSVIGDPVTVEGHKTVGNGVGDAVGTMETEISELDAIDFDAIINVDETNDNLYKLDG